MSTLYKPKEEQTTWVQIKTSPDKQVELFFTSDCGKHGAHEILDSYKVTPSRLLEVMQSYDNYTENEIE